MGIQQQQLEENRTIKQNQFNMIDENLNIHEMKKMLILKALNKCQTKIAASKELGISIRQLFRYIDDMNIECIEEFRIQKIPARRYYIHDAVQTTNHKLQTNFANAC